LICSTPDCSPHQVCIRNAAALTKDIEMGCVPCDDDKGAEDAEGAGVAKEADGARGSCDAGAARNAGVAVVATGVKETDGCGRGARLGDAGEAEVVAVATARKMEGAAAGGGDNKSGVRKWMRLLAQSINRFNWHSQLIPRTAVMSGSRGVTRNVIGMVWI